MNNEEEVSENLKHLTTNVTAYFKKAKLLMKQNFNSSKSKMLIRGMSMREKQISRDIQEVRENIQMHFQENLAEPLTKYILALRYLKRNLRESFWYFSTRTSIKVQ